VELKKVLLIILAVSLAVCLINRQPKLFKVDAENMSYEMFIKNNQLYEYGLIPKKLLNEKILDYKVYDLDSDKDDELLIISKDSNGEFGKDIVFYEFETSDNSLSLREIFRQDFSNLKPWKIDACNLDNDGEADIFVGVYKNTMFYEEIRKRPFFYSWDGENLNRKWLGSFFSDWELVDISFGEYFKTGYDVVAVIEKSQDDAYRIGFYNFVGFGFEHMKTINIKEKINTSVEEFLMKN
jgi:hypothetical protein